MKKICLLVVALACLMMSPSAFAAENPFWGILGMRLYASGNSVSATIGKCYAGYNSNIYLYSAKDGVLNPLAWSYTVGSTTITGTDGLLGLSQLGNSTPVTKTFSTQQGAEIVVGINANNNGTYYYSGSNTAAYHTNDIGYYHAKVDAIGFVGNAIDPFSGAELTYDNPYHFGGPVLVGFEDLTFLTSDKDFNDAAVVSISGVTPNDIPTVPEPGTILAALSILAPAGMIFRRKK